MNGIYGYKDLETGYVVYIGKDSKINTHKRHREHLSRSKYNKQPFNKILQKNPNRYKYFIVKKGYYSNEELNILEENYISFYGTYENRKGYGKKYGFNFTKGGEGFFGYKHTSKTKENMSISRNNSGFLRVSEHNKVGWVYECMMNGERIRLYKKTLKELEHEVKKKGLSWKVIDKEKAKLSQQNDLNKVPTRYRKNKTGIYRVSKEKRCWRYTYKDKNNNICRINSSSLADLKKKVLEKEEKWIVVEKDKLEKICEKYKYIIGDLL